MDAATRKRMLQYAEGKSDGSADIELSADDLFGLVDSALYPPSYGGPMPGGRSSPAKALSALEGLKTLGYDDRDLVTLKSYFDHCAEAEDLRVDASRALQRLRDEYYDDKDRKSGHGKASLMQPTAQKSAR